MSTLQSTLQRIGEEEGAPAGDWKPAGAVLSPSDAEEKLAEYVQCVACAPLPSVGNMVLFHLRSGDSRNMRTYFPAIVISADEEAGTLNLLVIIDANDMWMQERVPARVAPERGWELVRPVVSAAPINEVAPINKAVNIPIYDWPNPNGPVAELSDRLFALESRLAALEAKRGPGRPPNPDKAKE